MTYEIGTIAIGGSEISHYPQVEIGIYGHISYDRKRLPGGRYSGPHGWRPQSQPGWGQRRPRMQAFYNGVSDAMGWPVVLLDQCAFLNIYQAKLHSCS